jgi:anti-sigma regulatory factor (Ser/Thr protein kinase)
VSHQYSGEIGPLDLVVPALPLSLRDIRVAMRHWLSAVDAAPRAVADLLVAVGEACANVVEHAYGPGGGTVTVHMELQPPDMLATVRDTGCWLPLVVRVRRTEDGGRSSCATAATICKLIMVLAEPMSSSVAASPSGHPNELVTGRSLCAGGGYTPTAAHHIRELRGQVSLVQPAVQP